MASAGTCNKDFIHTYLQRWENVVSVKSNELDEWK